MNPERDELNAKKIEVDALIDKLKAQLNVAQANFRITGRYADPVWWARTSDQLARARRDSQRLQLQLGMTRYEPSDVAIAFIDIAKRRLSEEVWQEMMEEARDVAKSKIFTKGPKS